jgi:hypothetical protein
VEQSNAKAVRTLRRIIGTPKVRPSYTTYTTGAKFEVKFFFVGGKQQYLIFYNLIEFKFVSENLSAYEVSPLLMRSAITRGYLRSSSMEKARIN